MMMIEVMMIRIIVQWQGMDGFDNWSRVICFYNGHNMFDNGYHDGFDYRSTVYYCRTLVGNGSWDMDIFGHMQGLMMAIVRIIQVMVMSMQIAGTGRAEGHTAYQQK